MPATLQANRDQSALWNGASGQTWVDMHRVLDEALAPFGTLLIDRVLSNNPASVLDIGCGAGSTTLEAAKIIGQQGSCLGVDISASLIALAQERALTGGVRNAMFVHADAQTHTFESNAYDAIMSRFGVMFFDDPAAAFANIRRAARRDAALTFVAWRGPAENPFMTAAVRAAAPLLPALQPPDPQAPGQFGFADADRVRRILTTSGWRAIDIRPVDVASQIAERDLLAYVTKLGPVGLALKDVDDSTRTEVATAVHAAVIPFVKDGAARFSGACWLVTASG
jgi:SAM-dependent methyltransferase